MLNACMHAHGISPLPSVELNVQGFLPDHDLMTGKASKHTPGRFLAVKVMSKDLHALLTACKLASGRMSIFGPGLATARKRDFDGIRVHVFPSLGV